MAKKKPKKWIQEAIEKPGSLTRAAQSAGKTIRQFCADPDISTTNKRRCRLAETLRKLPRRGES